MENKIVKTFQVTVTENHEKGTIAERWEDNLGKRYCPYGAAITVWHMSTKKILAQHWHDSDGELHREGDLPARFAKDPYTDIVTLEEYFVHGQSHRELLGAPSHIERDPVTGHTTNERYKRDGIYTRDFGMPVEVDFNPHTGLSICETYLHPKSNKLFIIEKDPITGQVIRGKTSLKYVYNQVRPFSASTFTVQCLESGKVEGKEFFPSVGHSLNP
jgi:hypothetical protein